MVSGIPSAGDKNVVSVGRMEAKEGKECRRKRRIFSDQRDLSTMYLLQRPFGIPAILARKNAGRRNCRAVPILARTLELGSATVPSSIHLPICRPVKEVYKYPIELHNCRSAVSVHYQDPLPSPFWVNLVGTKEKSIPRRCSIHDRRSHTTRMLATLTIPSVFPIGAPDGLRSPSVFPKEHLPDREMDGHCMSNDF